jgi:hypothetical protein
MAWPYSVAVNWPKGQEPTKFDTQPVGADMQLYAGMPASFSAASSPVGCVRVATSGDKFAGFVEADACNTLANAAAPDILNKQNFGDGTTGAGGCKVRLRTEGFLRFDGRVPNGTGVAGSITGLVGTQADVNVPIYYNGTGFTTSAAAAVLVGEIAACGLDQFGNTYWDLRFRADSNRNS